MRKIYKKIAKCYTLSKNSWFIWVETYNFISDVYVIFVCSFRKEVFLHINFFRLTRIMEMSFAIVLFCFMTYFSLWKFSLKIVEDAYLKKRHIKMKQIVIGVNHFVTKFAYLCLMKRELRIVKFRISKR